VTTTTNLLHQVNDSVFIRLVDESFRAEDIIIGSLYVGETNDEAGILLKVKVEPYDNEIVDEWLDHFEALDQDLVPAIPAEFASDRDSFFVSGFDPNTEQRIDLDGDDDESANNAKLFVIAYSRTLRLIERVRRSEPVLIGYKSRDRHDSFWRGNRQSERNFWSDVAIEHRSSHRVASRTPGPGRVANSSPPEGSHLVAIDVRPVAEKAPKNQILKLHVCSLPDAFPYRFGPFFAEVGSLRQPESAAPIRIDIDGQILGGRTDLKRVGTRTNLFGRRLIPSSRFAVWDSKFQRATAYEITKVSNILP